MYIPKFLKTELVWDEYKKEKMLDGINPKQVIP